MFSTQDFWLTVKLTEKKSINILVNLKVPKSVSVSHWLVSHWFGQREHREFKPLMTFFKKRTKWSPSVSTVIHKSLWLWLEFPCFKSLSRSWSQVRAESLVFLVWAGLCIFTGRERCHCCSPCYLTLLRVWLTVLYSRPDENILLICWAAEFPLLNDFTGCTAGFV